MKKKSFTKLFLAIILFLSIETIAQNVGINADGATPHTSAMLDIDVSALDANSKKGLLIPRVSLQSTSDQTTIPTPATGLLIYNTNASITSGNGTGFYYFNGTSWVSLVGSNSTSVSQGVRIGFSSSTTWTCPAGLTQITVELWGGAGGGAARCYKSTETNCNSTGTQIWIGGNGGKGGYNKAIISVNPGQMYSIVIGNGGAAGTVNPSTNCQSGWGTKMMGGGPGGNGGASSFGGSLLIAGGGTGGTAATSTANGINGQNGQVISFSHSIPTSPGSRSYIPTSYINSPPTCCSSNGTTGYLGYSNSYEAGTPEHQPTAGESGFCVISY